MTLTEFRKNPELMTKAKRLRADPVFKLMLEVLIEEHVMYSVFSSVGKGSNELKVRLGQIEGYNMCLEKFRLFFEDIPEVPKDIKPTFKPQKI